MNSLVKVFSNFREFYSEINAATLTGAIDVVVVEQPDGSFLCSPFHVRFGKLGVLRSREKIVDIEINGEPVDIHMKLGESGEAFFVEEVPEDDLEEIPANMATSPIPTNEFEKFDDQNQFGSNKLQEELKIVKPRRNSIDLSMQECDDGEKKYENQTSEYSHRRHTDNTMERRDLASSKMEYTTQMIRQEWADHEDHLHLNNGLENTISAEIDEDRGSTLKTFAPVEDSCERNGKTFKPINNEADNKVNELVPEEPPAEVKTALATTTTGNTAVEEKDAPKEESKSKKKRRKKSIMKKKNVQRKNSSSSSAGSTHSDHPDPETDSISSAQAISMNTASSSTDSTPTVEVNTQLSSDNIKEGTESNKLEKQELNTSEIVDTPNRLRDLDIHFFSDTEVASGLSPRSSRPTTPIQSDTEFEVSQQREKNENDNNVMTSSASWKWGELPTQVEEVTETSTTEAKQAQRNSMLSGMFSFMKQNKKFRKGTSEGLYLSDLDSEGMDPEVAALYFPSSALKDKSEKMNAADEQHNEDDRESGNGTSLPQSPSSVDGAKSLDSDYEEGKSDKHLKFVEMSLCGGLEEGGPTDEEFEEKIISYSEVCRKPSLFSSPLLVVRLNGKYYSWTAACPIVMTLLTFQKPLPNDVVDFLTSKGKQPETVKRSSWWSWRRSGGGASVSPNKNVHIKNKDGSMEIKENEQSAVATQTSRPQTPAAKTDRTLLNDDSRTSDVSVSSTISEMNATNMNSLQRSSDKYRKSLRLNSEQIERLNLKNGVNEIVFSVTTAYQGTSRCKCYLFRWKYNDKVVISDIDGTITKSDVLGHILPMVGKDWAQIGVASLFSKIEENGYKLLYLSARAIGQSRATREYLRSIRQGDVKLPDGPLLLNPTSLISALHREVIEKKPEQFKIACLSDIQALFPQNPFYAGYGNRINDVWAYRAVGIPIMRIFTINTKGELRHELTQTFQSTYCSMAYIVDQLFPPIQDDWQSDEYSSFNYWREPVPDIDLEVDLSSSSAGTAGNNPLNTSGGGNPVLTTSTAAAGSGNVSPQQSQLSPGTAASTVSQAALTKALSTIPEN